MSHSVRVCMYPTFLATIAGEGPQPSTIVNSASGLAGPIAPGEWISIGGAQLGPPDGASDTVNDNGAWIPRWPESGCCSMRSQARQCTSPTA